jgi:predicted nuclease with TOPRIM domain
MSNVAEKLGDQTNRQVTDSDIESWALSAVGAIERFIAERNALRERVRAQDRELSLLREHVSLMRNSYRRLANEFVTQLEIVDNLVPETTQLHERQKPTESSQFELSKTRVAYQGRPSRPIPEPRRHNKFAVNVPTVDTS